MLDTNKHLRKWYVNNILAKIKYKIIYKSLIKALEKLIDRMLRVYGSYLKSMNRLWQEENLKTNNFFL